LTEFYQANTTKPYESIYIEFEGDFIHETGQGFAQAYDGLIEMKTLLHRAAVPPASCAKP
jgi:hypothetical protein